MIIVNPSTQIGQTEGHQDARTGPLSGAGLVTTVSRGRP